MKANNIPSLSQRLYSVWFRHIRVYTKHLISNGFPPFFEPLIMLGGIGLGLGAYITGMLEGMPFVQFLASGLMVSSAMFTAAFECSYGTFIRLEFDKVYDGMLAAPLTYKDVIWGEILFCATKGMFFSIAVLIVLAALGIFRTWNLFFIPLVGFSTGMMFAVLSLLVTAFTKNINYFNFYFTGFLSPMFMFSGIFFPISSLPEGLRIVAEFVPLTHPVRIARAICMGEFPVSLLWDAGYMLVFIVVIGVLATVSLKRRLIG